MLKKYTWLIEGVEREAEVYQPEGENLPILFAFHGHAGTGAGFARKAFESYYPKCIVVYPTGLIGGGRGSTETGWQHSVGEVNEVTGIEDQDLKFFDVMLAHFAGVINPALVFVHGWSNGGEFTYDVLWSVRGTDIAAICPASAILNTTNDKIPTPVMHIAGKSDPVVSFAAQEKGVALARVLNECILTGRQWATGENGLVAIKYSSKLECPVILLSYAGGHEYPDNVPYLIYKFFKRIAWGVTH